MGEGVKVVCLWLYYCGHYIWYYNRARFGGKGIWNSNLWDRQWGQRFLSFLEFCMSVSTWWLCLQKQLIAGVCEKHFQCSQCTGWVKGPLIWTQASLLQLHMYSLLCIILHQTSQVMLRKADALCCVMTLKMVPRDIAFFLVLTNILHICLYGNYFYFFE